MNFTGLLFLIITHFIIGRGLLQLFRLQLDLLSTVCLSFIISVPLMVLPVCVLQLMKIPITEPSVYKAISIFAGVCCVPLFLFIKRPVFKMPPLPKLYELPAFALVIFFLTLSVWRCYYMPAYARDMLSGPELIAEYTVREHTMVNSVFNVDLHTSNNYFKSPYITCLQIAYKLLVFPFGQLWLSILSVSFITWLYTLLRERIHPLLAGLLLVLFITVPELFAYSFVILYDYSNMVFFFSGFLFLARYLQTDRISDFAFSVFLFGLATFIRTESLILITMMAPLLIFNLYKKKVPAMTIALRVALLGIVPAIFYYICIKVLVAHFVPIPMDVAHEINQNLGDFSPLFKRLGDMLSLLIFSYAGTQFYGWYMFIFTAIFFIDLIFIRKYNKEAVFALYGIAVVYFGIGFIGYLLPLADLSNTTKRGLFKVIPIIILYMANSPVLLKLSNGIKKWENSGTEEKTPTRAAAAPKVRVQQKQGKK
ncbi:MAG: hypothetical protein JWQ38_918 [Flavipsychrobacter sp.]|nr:hypothetical protein [Flavipsychrobacter sp.]